MVDLLPEGVVVIAALVLRQLERRALEPVKQDEGDLSACKRKEEKGEERRNESSVSDKERKRSTPQLLVDRLAHSNRASKIERGSERVRETYDGVSDVDSSH